jgi:protein-S-isoprenylcysteine O-methyltransferase Ste14
MYTAFFLYSIGLALALPNWIAGPMYLATFGLLFALRVGREERMMRETFGRDYDDYAARTDRLVPGVW